MAKVVWGSDLNGDKLQGAAFAAELDKAQPSKGTFSTDYEAICATHGIIACPFISMSGTNVRIANATVDLASWRAALLAIASEGSTVKELSIHACGVTAQHIEDVVTTVQKMGSLSVLKMDYLTVQVTEGDAVEEGKNADNNAAHPAFSAFLKGTAAVEFLSLKGNNLNKFCTGDAVYNALSENLTLKALSLADNKMDDAACSQVLRGLRQANALIELSLAKNLCTGACLSELKGLLIGAEVSPEAEAKFKNITKLIGDQNKAIKDANKGRKKKGLAELPELVPPAERIEAGHMANRTVRAVDMSFCPLGSEAIAAFNAVLGDAAAAGHAITAPPLNATVLFRGVQTGLTGEGGVASLAPGLSVAI